MNPADFGLFYKAIHGHDPFPWQERLAGLVAQDGVWPDVLELPTASGKTSVLDIAVFHLALQAADPMRTAPLRMFFIVDRRLVVDEAEDHALRIKKAVHDATGGILAEVRDRLLQFGAASPLDVVKLRGGMYRDNTLADEPNQPLICLSTVDQVGSRLLFRGYQVGRRQQSVHAGLVGCDSLLIIDEAHLSAPFLETVKALESYDTSHVVAPGPKVVRMSATAGAGSSFGLSELDTVNEVLMRRLRAVKKTTLRLTAKFEKEAVDAAKELRSNAAVVGIVVNTVSSARTIFEEFKAGEAILLTGRVRPFDRDENLKDWLPLIRAGRSAGGKPLYVVATQTVEVGANLDFDALVTEAAPLDALRQRFGRLDRLGNRGETRAVILKRKEDKIYGPPLDKTWDWLSKHLVDGEIDFGSLAMGQLLKDYGEDGLDTCRDKAPLLFRAHLDSWLQTNPPPHPDPDVAPFLHGRSALDSADVQIVWRADLGDDEKTWQESVSVAPPLTTEALTISCRAARAWLTCQESTTVADAEGVDRVTEEERAKGDKPLSEDKDRRVLRWCGPDEDRTEAIRGSGVRPGDTIVVPASYGGCDRWGWAPKLTQAVTDIGNKAAAGRRKPVWRVFEASECAKINAFLEDQDQDTDLDDILAAINVPPHFCKKHLAKYAVGFYLEGPGPDETDEDDSASFTGRVVLLTEHMSGVEELVRKSAEACGLGANLVEDLRLAARNHDLGKLDPRFQAMLRFGAKVTNSSHEAWAKSPARGNRAQRRAASAASGYPSGARHEMASVALLEGTEMFASAKDAQLVRHLVGVHHGFGRALTPLWSDPEPPTVAEWSGQALGQGNPLDWALLDSGWIEQFADLNHRYGPWGLALLEAILRRADCVQSRKESNAKD